MNRMERKILISRENWNEKNTTLQPKERACDLISILSSVHQKSLVSGSSGFGTRSNNLTDRAHTVDPNCKMKPIGYLHNVKNGYSSISKFSRFNGVLRCGVPANRNIPAVVLGSVFNEHPEKMHSKVLSICDSNEFGFDILTKKTLN